MNRTIVNTLVAWLLAAIAIFAISYAREDYSDAGFWGNLMSGLHNTLFDLLFIGVLIFWLNRRSERLLEIHRYKEQLDLWRNEGSPTAIKNNLLSIRRLNEYGVYDPNLSGCVLDGIDLSGLRLTRSKLVEAQCFETNFKNTDLDNATLDKANLRRAVLEEAILTDASLRGTVLEYATLQKANLSGADFSDAVLSNVTWVDAIYDERTKLPHEVDKSVMRLARSSN